MSYALVIPLEYLEKVTSAENGLSSQSEVRFYRRLRSILMMLKRK